MALGSLNDVQHMAFIAEYILVFVVNFTGYGLILIYLFINGCKEKKGDAGKPLICVNNVQKSDVCTGSKPVTSTPKPTIHTANICNLSAMTRKNLFHEYFHNSDVFEQFHDDMVNYTKCGERLCEKVLLNLIDIGNILPIGHLSHHVCPIYPDTSEGTLEKTTGKQDKSSQSADEEKSYVPAEDTQTGEHDHKGGENTDHRQSMDTGQSRDLDNATNGTYRQSLDTGQSRDVDQNTHETRLDEKRKTGSTSASAEKSSIALDAGEHCVDVDMPVVRTGIHNMTNDDNKPPDPGIYDHRKDVDNNMSFSRSQSDTNIEGTKNSQDSTSIKDANPETQPLQGVGGVIDNIRETKSDSEPDGKSPYSDQQFSLTAVDHMEQNAGPNSKEDFVSIKQNLHEFEAQKIVNILGHEPDKKAHKKENAGPQSRPQGDFQQYQYNSFTASAKKTENMPEEYDDTSDPKLDQSTDLNDDLTYRQNGRTSQKNENTEMAHMTEDDDGSKQKNEDPNKEMSRLHFQRVDDRNDQYSGQQMQLRRYSDPNDQNAPCRVQTAGTVSHQEGACFICEIDHGSYSRPRVTHTSNQTAGSPSQKEEDQRGRPMTLQTQQDLVRHNPQPPGASSRNGRCERMELEIQRSAHHGNDHHTPAISPLEVNIHVNDPNREEPGGLVENRDQTVQEDLQTGEYLSIHQNRQEVGDPYMGYRITLSNTIRLDQAARHDTTNLLLRGRQNFLQQQDHIPERRQGRVHVLPPRNGSVYGIAHRGPVPRPRRSIEYMDDSDIPEYRDHDIGFDDGMLCMVCRNRVANVRLQPCGHVIYCGECATSQPSCRECGELVEDTQQ
ncbi:uncharacterized protein [Argopecten irradians]